MRRTSVLGAAAAAALAAGSLAATGVLGSSHREAPKILADPTADNTDVYAFTAPDAPHSLTVVANWIPLEEPAGGPYFGKLDPRARYYVKIDNTGDGRADVAYRWQFKSKFRNPNSFLDAAPTVDSVDDPDINFVQTYDLYKETYKGKHGVARSGSRTTSRSRRPTPGRRRSRTTPRSQAGAIRALPGGGKTFVGPSDDPFFVDLGAVFDGINIDKPGRPDDRARQPGRRQGRRRGLQHPLVRPAGAGVRGHARRQAGRRREGRQRGRRRVGDDRAAARERAARTARHGSRWVQVSRLGNPLINEVIIPIGQKDKFNRTSPATTRRTSGSTRSTRSPRGC